MAMLPRGYRFRRAPWRCYSFSICSNTLTGKRLHSCLKEARRVLRPGGIIRLAVPDIHKHVQRYIESEDADAFIVDTHLCRPRPRTIVQRLRILLVGTRHHQWMYDGVSLCRLLLANGFVRVGIMQPGETKVQSPGPLDLHERFSRKRVCRGRESRRALNLAPQIHVESRGICFRKSLAALSLSALLIRTFLRNTAYVCR